MSKLFSNFEVFSSPVEHENNPSLGVLSVGLQSLGDACYLSDSIQKDEGVSSFRSRHFLVDQLHTKYSSLTFANSNNFLKILLIITNIWLCLSKLKNCSMSFI